MEDWQLEDWQVNERKKACALYRRVMSAIYAGLSQDISPEDPNYKDVADLCEACFLASTRQWNVEPEKIVERILRWPHRHPDLIVFVLVAIEKADLRFLENPEEFKAEFHAAYNMMWAWLWHIGVAKQVKVAHAARR